MRVSYAAIAVVAITQVTAGCGSGTTPQSIAGPSNVVTSTPATVLQTLYGYVNDTGFRPVAGASIEVLNGQQAGAVMISDAQGRFSYPGMFVGAPSMRATKEGYAPATISPIVGTLGTYALFVLTPITPPVRVAGNYTLTIAADSSCTGIPDDVRTRSYAVTVALTANTGAPANTNFTGSAIGGTFAPFADIFWIGVAGDYVGVSTKGDGPSLIEQVGPNRYIAYYGSAGAVVTTPEVASISSSFDGTIEYCEQTAFIGQYYDCSPALAAVREECTSANSRLTLTRR
jgi:hypothetical protein